MVAGRTARFLLAAMLCQPASLMSVQSANALEIFGWKIFGSDDENEDVVDPLNYTVTLTVEGGDEELTEALNKASSLVQDVERPVSGSLGVLAKARSDRERAMTASSTSRLPAVRSTTCRQTPSSATGRCR